MESVFRNAQIASINNNKVTITTPFSFNVETIKNNLSDIEDILSGMLASQVTVEILGEDEFNKSIIQAKKEDIVIVKSPVGMPGRAIRNTFLDKVKSEGRIPPTKCLRCIHTCNPAETPYCITEALIHAAKGETENALLFCGGRAYEAKTIETVKKVIDYFCSSCI